MKREGARLVLLTFLALLLLPFTSATELGMNYYHESMMGVHGHYIDRTIEEAGHDFDDIKAISSNIKLYMNPFIDGNQEWVLQLTDLANQKGMHITVVMNVDDRLLYDSRWSDYTSRVLDACDAFSGKADSLFVGNEITLHSTFSDQEIRKRITVLAETCEQLFNGEVSYEEFWYAKDAWKGYNGKISFNLYENLDNFEANLNEMIQSFGKDTIVGEFGEDYFDDWNYKDEDWQGYEVGERWKLLQESRVPIAYVFTYREPSHDGFGLLRGDGTKKPAWDALKKEHEDGEKTLNDLSISCVAEGVTCQLLYDLRDDSCRTVKFNTAKGAIKTKACQKKDRIEVYRQEYPQSLTDFEACFADACVNRIRGFAIIEQENDDGKEGLDINKLKFTVVPSGTLLSDVESGGCRTVAYDTPVGFIEAKACEKTDHYEMYRITYPTAAQVCVKDSCVGSNGGFASFV